MMRWMDPRPWGRGLALVLLVVPAVLLAPADAQASSCGIRWGSLLKTAKSQVDAWTGPSAVHGVRAGEHSCYDRLVVDLSGPSFGASVQYVTNVYTDGAGHLVPLRGGARLRIFVDNPAYDGDGRLTYRPADPARLVDVAGYRTFRQVAWAGSFEGRTTIGLGVRARLPMRLFLLDGPGAGSRVVIDVAHHW